MFCLRALQSTKKTAKLIQPGPKRRAGKAKAGKPSAVLRKKGAGLSPARNSAARARRTPITAKSEPMRRSGRARLRHKAGFYNHKSLQDVAWSGEGTAADPIRF